MSRLTFAVLALGSSASTLLAQHPIPEPVRVSGAHARGQVVLVKLAGRTALVTTDSGTARAPLRGQVALRVLPASAGRLRVSLERFNLRGGSVRSRQGETGRFSATLVPGSAHVATVDRGSGPVRIPFTAALHYRLIDRLRGHVRVTPDDYAARVETMRGVLTVGLERRRRAAGSPVESARVAASLDLSQALLGAIRDIRFDALPAGLRALLQRCESAGRQVLCVQPVFIRDGARDPAPTGRSLDAFLARAEPIWRKCCINFDVRPARYIDDASFKVIRDDEVAELRRQDDVEDCVEVYFLESWDPPDPGNGGGVTYGGGTADAFVVTADNNVDQDPPSVNHLGHELGHAVTLCHPGRRCVAPRADGTPDTVMEPSGFQADNPDDQSRDNCVNASNPLLEIMDAHCCTRPEIH